MQSKSSLLGHNKRPWARSLLLLLPFSLCACGGPSFQEVGKGEFVDRVGKARDGYYDKSVGKPFYSHAEIRGSCLLQEDKEKVTLPIEATWVYEAQDGVGEWKSACDEQTKALTLGYYNFLASSFLVEMDYAPSFVPNLKYYAASRGYKIAGTYSSKPIFGGNPVNMFTTVEYVFNADSLATRVYSQAVGTMVTKEGPIAYGQTLDITISLSE